MNPQYSKIINIVLAGLLFIALSSSFASAAYEDGLVAYYPFDGDMTDNSGNENDATNNGAVFGSGINGDALVFDGTDDYVHVPVDINPDAMPQVTLTAWAKSETELRTSVISHDDGGYDRTINIDQRGGGTGWSAFSGSGEVLGYEPVSSGKWTFVAAVYDQDAGTVKLYVDGTLYEEDGDLGSGWDYTYIGSNPSHQQFFSGSIDEVRIYDYALSQNELDAIYYENAPGLVAYYPFDGDTADNSGNGNDATNNGAVFGSGVSGDALVFDGMDDYVHVPVNINPDVMPQLTLTAWAKSDTELRTAVISHDDGGYDRTINIDQRGGGTGWSAFSGSGEVLGYESVSSGKWTFLAAVYDQDVATVKLYVDGTLYEESGDLGSGWDYTYIGSNPSHGQFFSGSIDEVRIYNGILTEAELNTLSDIDVPVSTDEYEEDSSDETAEPDDEVSSESNGETGDETNDEENNDVSETGNDVTEIIDDVTDASEQVTEIVDEAQSAGSESAGILVAGSVIMALLFVRRTISKKE